MKTSGQLIKRLAELDAEIDIQQEALNVKKREYEEIKDEILLKMKAEETTVLQAHGITIRLNTSLVPQIKDWDSLEKFILRHKRLDLFQRRISVTTYRELIEERKEVPGIEPFEKFSLSVTRG